MADDFAEPPIPKYVGPKVTRSILNEADQTIHGQRAQDYGEARASFERVAAIWTAILGVPITGQQVALCMVGLKVSRATTTPDHRDSYVDIAGYGALAAQLGGVTP